VVCDGVRLLTPPNDGVEYGSGIPYIPKRKIEKFFVGNKSKYVGISNENIVNRYH